MNYKILIIFFLFIFSCTTSNINNSQKEIIIPVEKFTNKGFALVFSEDLSKKRTDKLLIVLLQAAIFEVLYRPQTSLNIIINEYLNTSDFFLEQSQKKYLNAILDKVSKKIRS